ncbi:putative Mutator transposable element [Fagus crenata]
MTLTSGLFLCCMMIVRNDPDEWSVFVLHDDCKELDVEHEEVAPLDMISGLVPMLEYNQAESNDDEDDGDENLNEGDGDDVDEHVNPTTQDEIITQDHVNLIVVDNINPIAPTTQENHNALCGEDFEDVLDGVSNYGDSDVPSTPPNSEDKNPKTKNLEFHAATNMSNPEFKLGMIFSDNKALKEAIRAYKIKWGFLMKFKKNEPKRVRVICEEGYDWRMHAIWKKDSNSFQIIKLVKEHSCAKAFHNRQETSKWVARVFLEKFRLDPNMKLLAIKASIMEQYEVEISMCKAYKERKIANEMINGRHLYANFKNKFKGKALKDLKDLMWAVANETTKAGFNAKMEHIKVLSIFIEHLYMFHLCIETSFCSLIGYCPHQILQCLALEFVFEIDIKIPEIESGWCL